MTLQSTTLQSTLRTQARHPNGYNAQGMLFTDGRCPSADGCPVPCDDRSPIHGAVHRTCSKVLMLIACLSVFFLVAGCVKEADSLYEEGHILPAHWPSSIRDAAAKLRERDTQLHLQPADNVAFNELIDLIEWTPEIVADSDLSESEWLPIFEQCEAMRKTIRSEKGHSLVSNQLQTVARQLDELADKVDALNAKNAEPL